MKKLIIAILTALTLASCSTMQHVNYSKAYVDSFVEQTRVDVIRRLGPPTFVVNEGDGWKTLVYIGHNGIFGYSRDYERSVTDLPTVEFVFDQYGICQKASVYNTGSVNALSVYGTLAFMATIILLFI